VLIICENYLNKTINDRSDANFNHALFDSLTIALKLSREMNEPTVSDGLSR